LHLITITHTHTHTHTHTLGRPPQDEESARRRDLYLNTYNIRNRQTALPPAGLKPTITANERPQTHALDYAATGIGIHTIYASKMPHTHHITETIYE